MGPNVSLSQSLAIVAAAVFVLVGLLAASPFATSTQTTLAFVEDQEWTTQSGAEIEVPLGAVGADATKTSWSPDGSELAFACNPESLAADADGRGLCSSTPTQTALWTVAAAPVRFPVWSSDGDQLAYAALGDEGHGSLWVSRRDEPGISETLCEDWCPLFRYYSLACHLTDQLWRPSPRPRAPAATPPASSCSTWQRTTSSSSTRSCLAFNTAPPGRPMAMDWHSARTRKATSIFGASTWPPERPSELPKKKEERSTRPGHPTAQRLCS